MKQEKPFSKAFSVNGEVFLLNLQQQSSSSTAEYTEWMSGVQLKCTAHHREFLKASDCLGGRSSVIRVLVAQATGPGQLACKVAGLKDTNESEGTAEMSCV